MADPNGGGGFFNADWVVPIYAEANAADYVVGTAERDRLLAAGWRDDGVAFYVPDDATKPVYRAQYDDHAAFFYVDGPEAQARASGDPPVDQGERFRVLDAPTGDAVALHRVTYTYAHTFDVLAAGDARYERVLHQGNTPLWSLTWPGITQQTTFVIEALDQGCPFPGGYIAPMHRDADTGDDGTPFNEPSITLDEARLASGEVFVNGQHDPNNRPRPIARAFVTVDPSPNPTMEFYESFDVGGAWPAFEMGEDNNGRAFRNAEWAIDTTGCTENFAFGPQLGQFHLGFADWGSSCNVSITPRTVPTHVSADRFLHVRMATDIPSTGRRYPQIMITTVPFIEEMGSVPYHLLPVHAGERMETEQTIVVQPFGGYHELQIQFCDQRAWGVNIQCPQANVYGYHAGNYDEGWDEPWTPVPAMGSLAGHDRPVQLDVYASSQRVYVYVDGRPGACAVLPDGRMPQGDVTVAYRAVLYHSGIDESVEPDDSPHQYLHRYSLSHDDHTMDDFGIENDVDVPGWDESVLPCGTRWYGGG
ncbi:MAG: hypothetical protein AB7S26_25440 [Sandaracinaceae bacterium]